MINALDFALLLASAGEARNVFKLPPPLSSRTGGGDHVSAAVLVGITLMVLGTLGRMYAYRMLGPMYTFHLSIKKEHKLITTGPYSIVRHPAYAASYPFLFGAYIAILGPGSMYEELGLWRYPLGWGVGLLFFVSLVYIGVAAALRTIREDKALKAEFGAQWDAWAAQTPYRLLPYVF